MGRMACGLFSRTSADSFWTRDSDSAREILDRRYASGDIGKEEYEQIGNDIQRTAG